MSIKGNSRTLSMSSISSHHKSNSLINSPSTISKDSSDKNKLFNKVNNKKIRSITSESIEQSIKTDNNCNIAKSLNNKNTNKNLIDSDKKDNKNIFKNSSTITRSRATSFSSIKSHTINTTNENSSSRRASKALSIISDTNAFNPSTPVKSRTLPLPNSKNNNNKKEIEKIIYSAKQKQFSMITQSNSTSKSSNEFIKSQNSGVKTSSPTTKPPAARKNNTTKKPTAITTTNNLTRKSSKDSDATTTTTINHRISPTLSTYTINTETNLEEMDLDQLEHLFLDGNRSPSLLSNYSSYVPWKPGVPIKQQDPLLLSKEEDVIGTADCGDQSLVLTDHFIELDEQMKTGLKLIQDAYNRKFSSLSNSLDQEKKKKGSNNSEVSQLRQKIRELSDSLFKEEEEKNEILHSKNSLLDQYNKLCDEHQHCLNKSSERNNVNGSSSRIISVLNSGKNELRNYLKTLPMDARRALLSEFLDCCHPHDIHMQQALLDYYVKTTFDVIGTLPNDLNTIILSRLTAEDLSNARLVSRRWREMVKEPNLWKEKCLVITKEDPVPLVYPSDPKLWETIYHGLHFREYNWSTGNVQTIKLYKGHTSFVTSLKLKKHTLITGSHDETLRIWDMRIGKCTKIIQCKAISCIDFVSDLRMVAAGFNDQGRTQVWHMDSGEVLLTLAGHNRGIRSLTMNKKYILTAGHDMSVIAWDLSGNKIHTFRGFGNMLLGIQIIGENNFIAVNSDGWIRTFSIEEKSLKNQYKLSDSSHIYWFSASGMDLTCSTTRTIYKLRWQSKFVKTGQKTEKGIEEVIIEPDLQSDPIIKQKISSVAEIFCGATDNNKDRIVVSTRFNSRTNNNKSIYVYTNDKGMNRFCGLWEHMSDQLATNNMGPVSMDLDHEKVVIGSASGMIYAMG
ncbi:2767_t:CDS:2, partial [Entrophospora sp. SA101]